MKKILIGMILFILSFSPVEAAWSIDDTQVLNNFYKEGFAPHGSGQAVFSYVHFENIGARGLIYGRLIDETDVPVIFAHPKTKGQGTIFYIDMGKEKKLAVVCMSWRVPIGSYYIPLTGVRGTYTYTYKEIYPVLWQHDIPSIIEAIKRIR